MERNVKTGDAIAEILKREGVEILIGYPVNHVIEAAARADIRTVIVRQERIGLHMADAMSRLSSGKNIGVFAMQHGPGSENAFGGVAQAFGDSVPILILPMGYERAIAHVTPNFNSALNFRNVTKLSEPITSANEICNVMRRAFTQLRNGRPAPVLVEIPHDLFAEEMDGEFSYRPTFSTRSGPDPDAVQEVAKVLVDAQRPVIYAGQGVHYAEAWPALKRLAELLAAPVTSSLGGKSAFPEDHHLSLGTGGSTCTLMVDRFLQTTDFILGVGTSFAISNFAAPMPQEAIKAQITNTPEDLNRDYRVAYGAVGDAKLVLQQLIEEAKVQLGEHGRGDVHNVKEEIKTIREEFYKEWGPRLISSEVPISPYRVFHDLMNTVDPKEVIVTHDSGYPRNQLVPFWPALTPRSYIGWGKSTQLGYGLGLALGSKMAAPSKTPIPVASVLPEPPPIWFPKIPPVIPPITAPPC